MGLSRSESPVIIDPRGRGKTTTRVFIDMNKPSGTLGNDSRAFRVIRTVRHERRASES